MNRVATTSRSLARRILSPGKGARGTWALRAVLVLLLGFTLFAGRAFWTPALGRSLVCDAAQDGRTDAILVDSVEARYLLFERAAELRARQADSRVFVLVKASFDGATNLVEQGIAELMAGIARIPEWRAIPFDETEPISLNVAFRIRDRLRHDQLSSVAIVTPAFRSRRAVMVYDSVLRDAGISTTCVPVFDGQTPETWTTTTHGIQEVMLQFLKLQYYRFWVMPFRASTAPGDDEARP